MWVKVSLHLDGDIGIGTDKKQKGLEAELEMKIDRSMRGDEFKNILQKTVLMIWNEQCSELKPRKILDINDKQLKQFLYEDGLG